MEVICMAFLYNDGLFEYTDKIVKYWPEFGKNNKEHITIADVMRHDSGLAIFTDPLYSNDLNHDCIIDKPILELLNIKEDTMLQIVSGIVLLVSVMLALLLSRLARQMAARQLPDPTELVLTCPHCNNQLEVQLHLEATAQEIG